MSVLLIDTYPAFRNWATAMIPEMSYYQEIDRMYGLGPALDVAGIRFGAVLLAIAHLYLIFAFLRDLFLVKIF